MATTYTQQGLNQALDHLKSDTLLERKLYASAREAERHNIVAIYLWWVEACKVPGYLDELYQQFSHLKRRQQVKAGINFDRLLYLVYGLEGLTSDDRFNKIVVLNQLHNAYFSNPIYYEQDAADKLAAWIVEQGGMTKIARGETQSSVSEEDDSVDDDYADDSFDYSSSGDISVNERATLSVNSTRLPHPQSTTANEPDVAQSDLEAVSSALRVASHAASSASYSVVIDQAKIDVVAESTTGQRYIGIDVGGQTLSDVFVAAYSKSFADLPPLLAAVCEVLSLQTPSLSLREPLVRLQAKTKDKRKLAGARVLAVRAATNELVLAPCSAALGVVVTATLKSRCFPVDSGDYVLSHFARRWTEHSLVTHCRARDYDIAGVVVGDDAVTVRLENRRDASRWSFLDFWLADDEQARLVNYKLTSDLPILAEVDMQFMIFQRFVAEHVDAWIGGFGRHIARDYNQHVRLDVDSSQLVMNYEAREGSYKANAAFDLPISARHTGSASLEFNSQDFYVTLSRLAGVVGTGTVKFSCYEEHFVVSASSTVADYRIVIPAINDKGYRTEKAVEGLQLNAASELSMDLDKYLEFDEDMRAEFASLTDDAAELFED